MKLSPIEQITETFTTTKKVTASSKGTGKPFYFKTENTLHGWFEPRT